MRATGMQPDAFFHAARTGRLPPEASGFAALLSGTDRVADTHPYWSEEQAQSMLIEEVEAIWAAIDRDDDWTPLHAKVEAVRRMGDAHGDAPRPAGQPQ